MQSLPVARTIFLVLLVVGLSVLIAGYYLDKNMLRFLGLVTGMIGFAGCFFTARQGWLIAPRRRPTS